MLSGDKLSQNMTDLMVYLSHLETAGFNGTVMLTFSKGRPTNLSKKEDLIVGQLGDAMRRSVFVQVKKSAKPPVENRTETPATGGGEGINETGRG
jgi:hypothetical protein